MKRRQRSLHFHPVRSDARRSFRRGISLHGHTQHSREGLGFLNRYVDAVPGVAQLARHGMARFRQEHGANLDFSRAFWTAPLSPRQAHDLERKQIEDSLDLEGSVSLTDHDNIDGAMEWPADEGHEVVVSLEWTLPYGPAGFHLGVHNLPREQARELTARLLAYSAAPEESQLPGLLATLDGMPHVLVVLNHPFWAMESLDPAALQTLLSRFLRSYGRYIHALEVSGLRPWKENQQVLEMAEGLSMPIVSGGDRHGWEAGTMLNLSGAGSFSEFVAEVRGDGRSEIVVMPAYQKPYGLRMMQIAWDLLRDYPTPPGGRRHWTERIFFEWNDGRVTPLSRSFKGPTAPELVLLVRLMMQLEKQPWHSLVHAAWSLSSLKGAVPPRDRAQRPAAGHAFPSGERSAA